MQYIVDVQGFKRPTNAFTFKEVAIVAIEEDAVPTVFLFEPPFSWINLPGRYKCENSWLTRNYHGMAWEAGEIPYADVQEIMMSVLQDAKKVYVKGIEKKKWIGRLIPRVYNLEDLGCPSLSVLGLQKNTCTHHVLCPTPVCAANNVEVLRKWYLNRQIGSYDEVDFIDLDVEE